MRIRIKVEIDCLSRNQTKTAAIAGENLSYHREIFGLDVFTGAMGGKVSFEVHDLEAAEKMIAVVKTAKR